MNYADIYRDTLPDQPDECIGLFLWASTPPAITDGSLTRYVQIQVRRIDGDNANKVANELYKILDSGADETVLHLTQSRWCIARPIAGPKKMTGDEAGRMVYYIEVSIWGPDDA